MRRAWPFAALLACTPTRADDERPLWPTEPAPTDTGDGAPADDDAATSGDAGTSSTDAADASTGAAVDFDPTFVHEQAEAALAQGVPGLAVAVVMDGEIVLAEGFGVADEAGTAVDATTLFNLASVTKSVTAMTVLSLRDEGLLGLDDSVPDIVPQFGLLPGHDASAVRVSHLLTHTSAIGDWPNEPFAQGDTLVDSFANNQNQPLWATPGAYWNYSNRGFELAGLVAAHAAGESFADAVQHRVLDPLGMTGATVDGALAATRTHARGESSGTWLGPLDYTWESYEPSGGLWAGADDLAELVLAYTTSSVHGTASPALAEMIQPIQITHEWPGAHYGHGLFVDTGYDPAIVSHGGSTGGYLADLQLVPEAGFGVVVVVNTDAWYPGMMSRAIVEHYLGPAGWVDVEEPLDPSSVPGTYDEPWHLGRLVVSEDAGALQIGFTDLGATVPLEPLWGASYMCTHPTDGYEMSFVFWPDAQGQAVALVGRDGVAAKIE